jgi:hypothetical protein
MVLVARDRSRLMSLGSHVDGGVHFPLPDRRPIDAIFLANTSQIHVTHFRFFV